MKVCLNTEKQKGLSFSFICFHGFFGNGTFQWVTRDSNKIFPNSFPGASLCVNGMALRRRGFWRWRNPLLRLIERSCDRFSFPTIAARRIARVRFERFQGLAAPFPSHSLFSTRSAGRARRVRQTPTGLVDISEKQYQLAAGLARHCRF
jgi:hypothetical protein